MFWILLGLSREVNHTCSVLRGMWLAVRHWCHIFMCTHSTNSGSKPSLGWQSKLMISITVQTKPDWSGLVLTTQNWICSTTIMVQDLTSFCIFNKLLIYIESFTVRGFASMQEKNLAFRSEWTQWPITGVQGINICLWLAALLGATKTRSK